MRKFKYSFYLKNFGNVEFHFSKEIENVSSRTLKIALVKQLHQKQLSVFQYINDNVQKLELCGFCNKNFAEYTYDIEFNNNEIILTNIRLKGDFECKNKDCQKERKHLNPNSFEAIAKRKKISLEEANKWQKQNNKSPFYYHEGESLEEYKKRQTRDVDFFVKKYGEDGLKKWKEFCSKISYANKQENVIKKHGEEYNKKLQNSKRQTLQNFIKRHGEEEGKKKYMKWVIGCTHIGEKFNGKKRISSKSAFNFFKKLEEKLLERNITTKEKIIYGNNEQVEYKIVYFKNGKLRWFFLDFAILDLKIDIEFNGVIWHFRENDNRANSRRF